MSSDEQLPSGGLQTWFVITNESTVATRRIDRLVTGASLDGDVWSRELQGWHAVHADVFPWPLSAEVRSALLGPETSLAVAGTSVPGLCLVASEDHLTVVNLVVGVEGDVLGQSESSQVARFVEWAVRHARKPIDRQLARTLRDAGYYKGQEVASSVLDFLGLLATRPERWEGLGGCTGPAYHPQPQFVGNRKMDWDTFRWIIASGDGFVGLWDSTVPHAPKVRFPKDGGLLLDWIYTTFKGYFLEPVLREQQWSGTREWAMASGKFKPAVVYNFDHCRHFTVMIAGDFPTTVSTSMTGEAILHASGSRQAGITLPPHRDTLVHFPLVSSEDARLAATAIVQNSTVGPWRTVPAEVPADGWSTLMWVRENAQSLP